MRERMKLIVGLGNPGEKYESTRHNVGFMVVDRLLKDFETAKNAVWSEEKKFKSLIHPFEYSSKEGKPEKIILAKPQTFMNNSGQAVSLLSTYYKIAPADIWVINDELDLPFGNIKIRNGGAAAGHHGVESIIASLNDDKFWRFRCGIGTSAKHATSVMGEEEEVEKEIARRKVKKVDDYVLGSFSSQEAGKLKELIKNASKSIEEALENGLKSAQNKYNTK